MNISEFDYTKIGFNVYMEKEGGLLGDPSMILGSVDLGEVEGVKEIVEETKEATKKIEGFDLENLRISTWIKSGSYLPGKRGFMLDGKTGFIECADLRVRGTGEIGGWNIDATRIYSDNNEIVLDSANTKITLGSGGIIESDNYVSGYAGAGFHIDENLAEFGNIACRGIFRSAVLQYDNTFAYSGNQIVAKGADVLKTTMIADDNSTVEIENDSSASAWAVGDILRLKNTDYDEWLEITSVTGDVYTCNRDKKGIYDPNDNPAWLLGQAVVNYGQSGDGGVYTTASEANAPYLSIFTHAGSPWTDLTTRLRIGNLNGYLGYTTDKYGIGIGDATHYLKYDPTDNLKLKGCGIEASSFKTATSGMRIEMVSVAGEGYHLTGFNEDGDESFRMYPHTGEISVFSNTLTGDTQQGYFRATANITTGTVILFKAESIVGNQTAFSAELTGNTARTSGKMLHLKSNKSAADSTDMALLENNSYHSGDMLKITFAGTGRIFNETNNKWFIGRRGYHKQNTMEWEDEFAEADGTALASTAWSNAHWVGSGTNDLQSLYHDWNGSNMYIRTHGAINDEESRLTFRAQIFNTNLKPTLQWRGRFGNTVNTNQNIEMGWYVDANDYLLFRMKPNDNNLYLVTNNNGAGEVETDTGSNCGQQGWYDFMIEIEANETFKIYLNDTEILASHASNTIRQRTTFKPMFRVYTVGVTYEPSLYLDYVRIYQSRT